MLNLPGIEPGHLYRVSAALVNTAGVQSLFSAESNFFASANTLAMNADKALLEPPDCLALGFDWHDVAPPIDAVTGEAAGSDPWQGI